MAVIFRPAKVIKVNERIIENKSVECKGYGRILIDRVRKISDAMICDERDGFRPGRGCVDQVVALRQLFEKARERNSKVCVGFMDLEKAYERVEREAKECMV